MTRSAHPLPRTVAGAPRGDLQALYEAHGAYVRRLRAHLLGPGVDPDDVTQDVFMGAWRKLDEFHDENPRAWLSRIAVKRASYWRRRMWVGRFLGLDALAREPADLRTPEDAAMHEEARRLVYRVLDRMSQKRRTVFVLFELQGMSGEEIAHTLGCPLRTVHTRLFRARREFQARILAEPGGERFDEGEGRA